MIADPYPPNLIDDDVTPFDGPAYGVDAKDVPDPVVVALNRIAVAIERQTQALMGVRQSVQNAPQRPGNLQALPPVQQAGQRPACPYHGIDKVAPSTNGKGGYYCQAKGGPDVNAKGYCRWHT